MKKIRIRSLQQLEEFPSVKLVLLEAIRFYNEVAADEYPGDSPLKLDTFFEFSDSVIVSEMKNELDSVIWISANAFHDEGGPSEMVAYVSNPDSDERELYFLVYSFDERSDFLVKDGKPLHWIPKVGLAKE